MTSELDARIALCAAGEAAWHRAAYAGLGAEWIDADGLAWAPRVPHRFLLGAITLAPRPRLPAELAGEVRDSWAALHDALPAAWRAESADPWMLRAAGGCPMPVLADVTIERTDDAELFEHTSFVAAAGKPPQRPGELHPRGSERVPGLRLFLAWRAGRAVGSVLAVVHESGVVVSAVAVLADERRRGIGAALTAAAINAAPDRPATLSAGRLGAGLYRRLGFETVSTPLGWRRG